MKIRRVSRTMLLFRLESCNVSTPRSRPCDQVDTILVHEHAAVRQYVIGLGSNWHAVMTKKNKHRPYPNAHIANFLSLEFV